MNYVLMPFTSRRNLLNSLTISQLREIGDNMIFICQVKQPKLVLYHD